MKYFIPYIMKYCLCFYLYSQNPPSLTLPWQCLLFTISFLKSILHVLPKYKFTLWLCLHCYRMMSKQFLLKQKKKSLIILPVPTFPGLSCHQNSHSKCSSHWTSCYSQILCLEFSYPLVCLENI